MELIPWMFQELWQVPIYRALVIVLGSELFLLTALMTTLSLLIRRRRREDAEEERLREHLGDALLTALAEGDLDGWRGRAEAYDHRLVRALLFDYMAQVDGVARERLIDGYRSMGMVDFDLELLESHVWEDRLHAMRRLFLVAGEDEVEAITRRSGDRHAIQLLAAQTLARLGRPDAVARILRGITLRSRTMEQPVTAIVEALDPDDFEVVFADWDHVESPRVRRILLCHAAQLGIAGAEGFVEEAAESDDMELRIAACTAAATLTDRASARMLERKLHDPHWEVRARAAQSLGKRREDEATDGLDALLDDPAFWVRQNAAIALRRLGDVGRARLQLAVDQLEARPGAADVAAQEIQRHEFLKFDA